MSLINKNLQLKYDLLSKFNWEGSILATIQSGQITPSIQKGQIEVIVNY